jgi:hypothetical protein
LALEFDEPAMAFHRKGGPVLAPVGRLKDHLPFSGRDQLLALGLRQFLELRGVQVPQDRPSNSSREKPRTLTADSLTEVIRPSGSKQIWNKGKSR